MQTRFLLLVPLLVSIAGCSQKIEAQKNDPTPNEIGAPPEQDAEASSASEEQETDFKLRSPVGHD